MNYEKKRKRYFALSLDWLPCPHLLHYTLSHSNTYIFLCKKNIRVRFTVLKTRIKMLKIGTMNLKIHTEEYGQIIKRKKYLVNSVTSPPYYAEQKLAQYRIGLSLKITCCKTAMPYSLFTCTSVNVPALHSRLANGM